MTTNSADEFKAELLRLIYETERKVEQIRAEIDYANYDSRSISQAWEQGVFTLLPLMQGNPLWAFETLFDFLKTKGYRDVYTFMLVQSLLSTSLPIPQEIVSMLKDCLFETELPFLKQSSLQFLGFVLDHQPDKKLQNEIMGFLLDEDLTMRLTSVSIFSELLDERTIPFLRLLLDDPDYDIRLFSRLTLERFNTPESNLALEEWRKHNF